ncbi:MAG: cache domain-containing protein [Thermodesulfobacteriota bacterium]|nr:cache domain-containing protein [Thermodesulfobacteriota bacterium]
MALDIPGGSCCHMDREPRDITSAPAFLCIWIAHGVLTGSECAIVVDRFTDSREHTMGHPFFSRPRLQLIITITLLLFLLVGCGLSGKGKEPHNLQLYDYRDTKRLVRLLADAALVLAAEGEEGFAQFRQDRARWTYEDAYLYAYDVTGRCVFHGGMPELEGKELMDVEDTEGRKSLRMAFAAVNDRDNPHGWVHYWWNIPNRLYPVWKSSCHSLVTFPNGKTVLLGAGMANLPQERAFVKIIVDGAARQLAEEGAAALDDIRDPLSKYDLPGASIFVVSEKGDTLIAPAFRFGASRNILDYEDDAGHTPLREAILRLQEATETWVVILARNPQSMSLTKKGLYVRKIAMDGERIYVGATADLPKPSWMK